jgi:sugar/nucleoside kinase (ribokinase family)
VRFIAVGDVMVDIVCDRLPERGARLHGGVFLRAGGSAVNAALAAAELGASADVIGRVGADAAGDVVVATLDARGINAHLARDKDVPTGVTVAFADAVIADRGANARLAHDDLPRKIEADALLVSGFALFQDGSRDAARAALDRFDGAWSGIDLSSPRLAAGAKLDVGANVVFATAAEAKAVTGLDPEAAAQELARRFTIACVKLGAEGAVAVRGNVVERAQAARVARTSPFGAGDAFAATFLVGLAGGHDLGAALERACAAGARAAGSA